MLYFLNEILRLNVETKPMTPYKLLREKIILPSRAERGGTTSPVTGLKFEMSAQILNFSLQIVSIEKPMYPI